MTKGLVAREPRKAEYSLAQVVITVQESAWVDEATFLYCETLYDNPNLIKTLSFCLQQRDVLEIDSNKLHII